MEQGSRHFDLIDSSCMPQLDIGLAHIADWGNTWSALLELVAQRTALEGNMSTAQVCNVVAAAAGRSLHGTAVRMLGYTHIRMHYLEPHQPEE